MTLLRLHYAPDNASLCVRLALLALDTPFETVLIDRSVSEQNSDAFHALNPAGKIPALTHAGGTMFETGAILLWLADQQAGRIFPTPDAASRPEALSWLFWLTNTLHPALRMDFYPEQYFPERHADAMPTLCRHTRTRISGYLTLLENRADWLDDADAIALGCYLAPLLRWLALYGSNPGWFDLNAMPRLLDFARRFEQTAHCQTAAKAEGLGPAPISQPCLPDPPEGVAL